MSITNLSFSVVMYYFIANLFVIFVQCIYEWIEN